MRPLETLSRLEFDVIVLGGGPAGCVLAGRLTENEDCTVCLVEAGPDYGASYAGGWPTDLLDARSLAFSHSWPNEPETDRSQLRARVIGGCSTHNACAVYRGSPSDYEWSADWTFDSFEPYLARAEQQLGVRHFDEEELAPWHRALISGALELGIPQASDPNDGSTVGCASANPVNAQGSLRWNAAFAYLDAARRRSNLTIVDEAIADSVIVAGGKVLGAVIHRRGRKIRLEGDTVVLACGAYGSPLVLQRSGIGPEEELRRHGIAVASNLPVGEGLIDHPGVGASWEPTAELHEETTAFEAERPLFMGQVTVRTQSAACGPDDWDTFLFPACDPSAVPGRYETSAAVFAMKPRSRGRVRLRSADPDRPPAIEHGFLSDDSDTQPLVEGVELLRRIVATEAVMPYVARELRPGPGSTLTSHIRANVRGFFHPVGTCALGPVCTATGRVHGFDNLLVADAAFIPEIPRANTHLTVLAVAERIAERL